AMGHTSVDEMTDAQRKVAVMAEKLKRPEVVKKISKGGNIIFWIFIAVIIYNTGLAQELYHFVMGLAQGNP
ncbi:MAG: hypothetical protein ABI669_05735, partial [Usitatibacter sp.]